MSWKKSFARNVRFSELMSLGAFKVGSEPPEPLGKGKFRVMLELKDGTRAQIVTFEGSIGDMIYANPDGWIEAYTEKVGKETYIRIRAVPKEPSVK